MFKIDVFSVSSLLLLIAYIATVSACKRELLPPMTGFLSVGILGLISVGLFLYTIINLCLGKLLWGESLVVLIMQGLPVVLLGYFVALGFYYPVLHDVSTDIERPPKFKFVPGSESPRYQFTLKDKAGYLKHYGDLTTLHSNDSPEVLYENALQTCLALGFYLVYHNKEEGHIEASVKTKLINFTDDVVIRIMPTTTGAKLDIRSISRLGQSDFGANGKRIAAFLKELKSI